MPKDQRAVKSGGLTGPVARVSRRLKFGVAGRIMFANSIMLVGIMVLTTSLLYIQLSQLNQKREQDLLGSAADNMSMSLSLVGSGEATTDDFIDEGSQDDVETMLENVVSQYDFDVAAVVPIDYLVTPPSLGSSNRQERIEANIVSSASGDVPDDSVDQLAAAVDGSKVSEGESVVRFLEDGGPGSGTMYVISPVFAKHLGVDDTGPNTVVGAVVVGNSADSVREGFLAQSNWLIGIAITTLILGIAASWATSRGLRRVTGDYGANELRGMLEFYSSVLKAVSEGLLLLDRSTGIVLINAEARELLGLPAAGEGKAGEKIADTDDPVRATSPIGGIALRSLNLPDALRDLLSSGRWARDEIHYTDDRVLVVNQQPTDAASDTWVVTMRDHTELAELSGELVSVRSFSDSLRAQTHEYANRLHMVVSLLETGHVDEAIEFAAKDLDDLNRVTGDGQMSFDHPVLSALLLSKIAQAAEVGIDMTVDTAGLSGRLGGDDRDLATILGNLIDNAFDALRRQDVLPEDKRVHVHLSGAGGASGFTIEVSDDGPGIDEEYVDAIFERGWSTKHDGVEIDKGLGRQESGTRGVGLSLVVQAIRRLGGAVDVQGRGEDCDEFKGAVLTVWLPDTSDVDPGELGQASGNPSTGPSSSSQPPSGNPPTGPIQIVRDDRS
ncbi:MAG: sensor histidine kinase [Brevibacterium aurantiacum]|uniref:histidine kinase n=8 Tax=Brevibacterium aurantiacum TaxID=273384 RepID=A0A1D7W8V2_BREAU|nr:ATP-binding protein [Brevibacterium aurantiacum]MDN5593722.1 ATP-binding protein [Brevibacterium sp.]AOP55395.1 putative two-component sensor kinase [Brevibacterium aurantiacum]AZL10873.1 GHKL domain-containing protein [Brevibacterium aurantiacum]AZT98797.1 GHKL domain-containing protein [Brevibacterium aurantiacum]MDN6378347.1 ATP-binding protein [Brevibacterium aurantiacum]